MNQSFEKPRFKIIGSRPVRPDGVEMVTGKAAYGADFKMPGMLVGKVKRSPHAHARILSIEIDKAQALRGVKAVIVGRDLLELDSVEIPNGERTINLGHLSRNCLARDKVLYEGHAVAAVAATSPEIAEQALQLIDVIYEPLPHIIDIEAAMEADAPLLHENLFTKGLESPPKHPSNIASRIQLKRGDVETGLARADVLVERTYKTPSVHQGYIEPHACVASMSSDGQAKIWCSTQGAFMVRTVCAAMAGMDQANLRVIPSEIGGGFGGKTTIYLEPLALALSGKSGRPVKIVMTRDEVFRATGPASGAVMHISLGATLEGQMTAADVELKFQAGAFPGSPVTAAVAMSLALYDIPDFKITGWDVVTNTPKVGAYRAPGAPTATFAVESAVDELAKKLKLDPIELRRKNGVCNGMKAPYGPTYTSICYQETLDAIKSHPHYSAPLGPNQGRGVAAGFWFNFGGDSTVIVCINDDGSATVATGNPDIGGTRATMAMMAAEVLGLPVEKVRAIVADTASIGFSQITGGSRTTFATGIAVVDAASELVTRMKARAALIWDVPENIVDWKDGQAFCREVEKDNLRLTIAEIAKKACHTGGPLSVEVSVNPQGAAPAVGVHLCDVEVDQQTGHVTVLRYTVAQDVGRAIHPGCVEGQLQGGAVQGIGWALNEEYVYDSNGVMENPGFLDYRMPVASDLPMIETILIEMPNPHHPFGVKGVGEVPIVPPLAAVANAVYAATGRRFFNLPLSPPRVHAALKGNG